MSDDGYRRSENYAEFQAGRVKRVRTQALERLDGVQTGRDFSDPRWEIRFRAYQGAPVATGQVFVLDLVKTKLVGKSLPGDTGKSDVSVCFPWSDVGEVTCEEVAIDTLQADATTASGSKEYEIDAPWRATVYASSGAP